MLSDLIIFKTIKSNNNIKIILQYILFYFLFEEVYMISIGEIDIKKNIYIYIY
jgi:hypothetical protein